MAAKARANAAFGTRLSSTAPPSATVAMRSSITLSFAASNAQMARLYIFFRFFRASALRRSLNSRSLPRFLPRVFRHVGCGTPTKPRRLFSRLSCLLTCDLRAILLSSLRVPRFPRRCPNFAAAGTVAAVGDVLPRYETPIDWLVAGRSSGGHVFGCHLVLEP